MPRTASLSHPGGFLTQTYFGSATHFGEHRNLERKMYVLVRILIV